MKKTLKKAGMLLSHILIYAKISIYSIISSVLVTYFWAHSILDLERHMKDYLLSKIINHVPSPEDNMAFGVLAGMVGIIYGIFATRACMSAWERLSYIEELCKSVHKKNGSTEELKDMFILKTSINIHPANHFAIGFLATIVNLCIGLLDSSEFAVITCIFFWNLVCFFLMFMADKVDDPMNKVWGLKPPVDWLLSIQK